MLSVVLTHVGPEQPWADPAALDAAGGPTPDQAVVWAGYSNEVVEAATDAGAQNVIEGVPAYHWYRGCGPTAAGMVVGYWDGQGFDDLIAGSVATQTSAVDAAIASTEHYDDYAIPIDNANTGVLPDRSSTGGAHESNSIADWMHTSRSSDNLYYGWSYLSRVDDAIDDYCDAQGYPAFTTWNETWSGFTWDDFVAEIDANRPMVFLVDTDADGSTDHFVTAIGYDADSSRYACYNTWDSQIHWYDFAQSGEGQAWGIYGATFIAPPGTPPVADAGGPYACYVGTQITLDASGSTDPGSGIVSYAWDTDNDGEYDDVFGETADYIPPTTGTLTVAVKVTNVNGAWDTDSALLTVNAPLPGDADYSGTVDNVDATIVAAHWHQPSDATWAMGDFNGDGAVDDRDAAILAAHWTEQPAEADATESSPDLGAAAVATVPRESPTTSARLAVARRLGGPRDTAHDVAIASWFDGVERRQPRLALAQPTRAVRHHRIALADRFAATRAVDLLLTDFWRH